MYRLTSLGSPTLLKVKSSDIMVIDRWGRQCETGSSFWGNGKPQGYHLQSTIKVVKNNMGKLQICTVFNLLRVSLLLILHGDNGSGERSCIVDLSAVLQRWDTSFVDINHCVKGAVVPRLLWQWDVQVPTGGEGLQWGTRRRFSLT